MKSPDSKSKLSSLIRPRNAVGAPAGLAAAPPRDAVARLARWLPAALVVGFVALIAILFGERFLPARDVDIRTVVTVRTGSDGPAASEASPAAPGAPADFDSAEVLFQASGWIEPDPLPIKATALVSGVVDRVEALEGERVTEGQLLAVLIDDDARLDLRTAEAALASLRAQAEAHHAALAAARAKLATLEKQIAAAEARGRELKDRADRLANLPAGNLAENDVVQAKLQLATQDAEVAALAASEMEHQAEVERLSKVALDFTARIDEAQTEVDRRKLALERTHIQSPVDGIVLRLLAAPGQKRMLEMDDPDSATIAILYRPEQLQARIDVPLEDAAMLAPGQAVRVRSNFLPDRVFRGTVTRIVGEADLQRNTLQAKVRIEDPDPRLRPEMLCRAEFLDAVSAPDVAAAAGNGNADPEAEAPSSSAGFRAAVFVPEAALLERSGDSALVWMIDPEESRAISRSVTLGSDRRDDHVVVRSGLGPGDRVIVNPPADLSAGDRVEDTSPD